MRRISLVAVVSVTLVGSMLSGVPALAAPGSGAGGLNERLSRTGAVAAKPGTPMVPGVSAIDHKTLPSAGSGVVTVDAPAASIGGLKVTATSVDKQEPLSAREAARSRSTDPSSPASVRVSVVDPAKAAQLGAGVLLSVSRGDEVASTGRAEVSLDYTDFTNAFGAGYGSRLRLVQVPACALTTPERKECQTRTELGSRNAAGKVTAQVPVPADPGSADVTPPSKGARSATAKSGAAPMALAAVSGSSSAGGDFTATPLSQASSWAAGSQGGGFSYSYPFALPPGTGGPVPQVALSYDSGGADGQTSTANGQSSWVGEGWDYQPGFIERSYRPCKTDGTGTTSDNCWFSDNATILWNGRSMPLVRDASTGVWRGTDDDGLRIDRLTGGDNGDNDGEYWKLTDKDGVQYFFGKNKRYAGDTMTTESVLTVPVYGNNVGEPCYNSPIQFARCQQAYRWNLDYVVDPRGNSMTYHYQRYLGRTGLLNNAMWGVAQYHAASTVDWLEYGTRAGSEATTGGSVRVEFGTTIRCIGACGSSDYPDAAWDTFCWSDTSCPNAPVPTYVTPWKLSTVTTKIWTGSTYRPVDRWDLAHSFREAVIGDDDSGATRDKHLWLDSVTHTGYAPDGATQAEPAMTFVPTPLANRVHYGSALGLGAYGHNRIGTVKSGHGSETRVLYSGKECAAPMVAVSDSNPYRCFPQYGQYDVTSPAGYAWFHKYVVDSVTEVDLTGGGPDETWRYWYSTGESSDSSLWRIVGNEGSSFRHRSWSAWAGYSTVSVVHGAGGPAPTQTTTTVYHRGMDGDARATGDPEVKQWTARRAGATLPLGTPNLPHQVAGSGGMCVDRPNWTMADGTGIQLAPCNNDFNQMWWRSNNAAGNSNWINPQSGKCLDLVGGSAFPGTRIQLWTCNTSSATQWFQEQPDGSLKNVFSGRCLDTAGGGRGYGAQLIINDCDGSYRQNLMPNNAHALVTSDANRCLNINSAGWVGNGGLVRTDNCGGTNGAQAETWTLRTDGSLLSAYSGRCLDLVGSGTVAGTAVQLWDCVASGGVAAANQRWVAQADGSLKNPASGRCLDPGDHAVMLATPVLADCAASTRREQRWVGRYIDKKPFAGKVLESRTINGDGSIAAATTHGYATTQTGHRVSPVGGPQFYAHRTNETVTGNRTWIAATSTWRRTQTEATFDIYNLPVDSKDQGDLAVNGDETCTHVDYARDTGAPYFINFPSQTITSTCAYSPGDADYLSGTQVNYDAGGNGAAPTMGLPKKSLALAGVTSGVRDWKQVSRASYDTNGRATSTFDALDRESKVAFTPASGPVAVTSVTTTNPANWTSTVTLDAGRGLPLTSTDANSKTNTMQYDPLGRFAKGWAANRATSGTPDVQVTYNVSNTAASWVKTGRLGPNGNVIDSYAIYDGRLRARQSQGITQDGYSAVSDTAYDTVGRVAKASIFKHNSAPVGTLRPVNETDVTTQHRYVYDGLGRPLADELWGANVKHSQTAMAHDGDRVTTTPPSGGTASTVFTDPRGLTTTARQFLGSSPSGSFQDTTFEYDRLGRQTSATSAGSTWTTSYHMQGWVKARTDPDTGLTTMTYDNAGQLRTTTDADSRVIAVEYDNLGRKTGLFKTSVTGTKLASWTFDTLGKGQLTSSTRHDATGNYTTAVTEYDDAYRVLGSTVTVPSGAGAVAGTYAGSMSYKVNGDLASVTYPAAGGLAAETVNYAYNAAGQQTSIVGLDSYLAAVTYFFDGGAYQTVHGSGAKRVKVTTSRQDVTNRLTAAQVDTERPAVPETFDEQYTDKYSYDQAGNVLGVNETKATATVSNQCFGYDGLRRMTESWTTVAGACQSAPSSGVLGGADPYWTTYGFDPAGNRTTELKHAAPGGGLATDTLRTYTTPGAGQPKAHSLTKVDTKVGAAAATTTDTFSYDATGNTLTHNAAGYTWNELGKLSKVAVSGGPTTDFVHDADGNRVLRKDSTGTTVYLGSTEVHADPSGSALTAVRTYPGAVRTTAGGLAWMVADHHGTSQTSIKASDLTVTRRRTDPFGGPRGTAVAWPTQRGFVNGVNDPDTKLVHIGARDYDPALGRFISVDPVFDGSDPQSWNGYAYSNNAPATSSDPDGMQRRQDDGGSDLRVVKSTYYGNGVVLNDYSDGTATLGGATFDPDVVPNLDKYATAVKKFAGELIAKSPNIDPQKAVLRAMLMVCAAPGSPGGQCDYGSFTVDVQHAACEYIPATCQPELVGVSITGPEGAAGGGGSGAGSGRRPGYVPGQNRSKVLAKERAVKADGDFNPTDGCKNSFAPETLVLLADGSKKPIKDVVVGDVVLAADPESGDVAGEPVTLLHLNDDQALTDLEITNGSGQSSVVHTTQDHPFWDATTRRWVLAGQLAGGHELLASDGSAQRVGSVRNYVGQQWMFNLTVANLHTYYVVAGSTPVLVHNCNEIRGWTKHGVEQAEERGISEDMAEAAVRTGRRTPGNRPGTTKHSGRKVWVVLNRSCEVVSCGWR